MKLARIVGLITALAVTLTPALPQTPDDLAAAIAQVRKGDFESAVLALDTVIQRAGDNPAVNELVLAYFYLGVCYLELDQVSLARSKFQRVLQWKEDFRPDPGEFSNRVIQEFEAVRREVATGTMASKHGGSRKILFIGAGVAAAAGAVALASGSKAVPAAPQSGSATTDLRLNGQNEGTFFCSGGLFFTVTVFNPSTAPVSVSRFDLNFTSLSPQCMSHDAPVDGTVGQSVGAGQTQEIRRIDLAGDLCQGVGRQPGCQWRGALLVRSDAGTLGDNLSFQTAP